MQRFNPQMKMFYHSDRVEKWLAGEKPAPILVEIDPTSRCNASCPWCSYAGRQQWMVKENHTCSDIDSAVMHRALLEMRDSGVKAINWTGGGEPTLHKDLDTFVVRAHDLGMKQGLFTNCVNCRYQVKAAKHLSWVRVSLTDKYMDGIDKDLLRHYISCASTGICANLTPETVAVSDEWCAEAKELGAAYFQVRPALRRRWHEQPDLPELPDLKRHETETFKVFLSEYKFDQRCKPKSYTKCYGGPFVPVIDYWGNVRRCNYHLNDPSEVIGNLADKSFGAIMADMPRAVDVRKDCQSCCKNHELNLMLNGLLSLTDVEFV